MALPEALWRNSLWSRDNYDVGLHSPEELATSSNRASGNEGPPPDPGPVSKWSTESDNDDDWNADRGSRLFQFTGRSKKDAAEQKHDLPSQMPRAYVGSRRSHRNSSPDARPNGIDEGEQDRRQDAIIQENVPAPEPPRMSILRETLFVTTICVAHLCAQAGIGQTFPVMRSVASRLRVANANDLSSSISGYAIVLGIFILIARRLGKTFGHKPIFMVGLIWSAIWSLIVGASFYSTRSLFIASRAFQGLGAALTLPTGLALLTVTRPTGTRKTIIMSLYVAMSPTGLLVGALGASILDEMAWWPWVYWAFSITLVVLRTVSRFVIPSTPPAKSPPQGARATSLALDIPGTITWITSLGLFGFAWGQAHMVGWEQGYIWIILIMSAVLAAAFVMIEAWYTQNPLIPYSALSLEVFLILVAIGSGWSCFGIWMFYGWQFVERFRSASSLLTTTYFIPVSLVGCFAAVTARLILSRFGPHGTFCVSMLAMMLASVLIATMPTEQSYWQQLFISTVFMAWGVYTSVPVATLMVSRAVKKSHAGISASLVWVATYYGTGLGLAVAGTAEHGAMNGKLTLQNRLGGHKVVYWTSVGMSGFGLLLCLALTFASRSRKGPAERRRPCCQCNNCQCRCECRCVGGGSC